jgi:hypothetical protein
MLEQADGPAAVAYAPIGPKMPAMAMANDSMMNFPNSKIPVNGRTVGSMASKMAAFCI